MGKTIAKKVTLADATVDIPAVMIPAFRATYAVQQKAEKRILFYVIGGLGDAVCAEPTLRWATRTFKDCEFYVASFWPELFNHLPIKQFFDLKSEPRDPAYFMQEYFVFINHYPENHLQDEFMEHMWMHPVDYTSIAMFRCQLRPQDKNIVLRPSPEPDMEWANGGLLVHPGKSWQSKTFPNKWWNQVLERLVGDGHTPILIGNSTVDVNSDGCKDLRNKTTLNQMIYLCQRAKVLITNDSAPMHIASSGKAFIDFISTVKRPDLLMHTRAFSDKHEVNVGERMRCLNSSGMWSDMNLCPNNRTAANWDQCTEEQLKGWLPHPIVVSSWSNRQMNYFPFEEAPPEDEDGDC